MVDPVESPKSKSLTPMKLIAYSAAGILVSFGLIAAGAAILYADSGIFDELYSILMAFGVGCCAVSVGCLLYGVLWSIGSMLAEHFGRREP